MRHRRLKGTDSSSFVSRPTCFIVGQDVHQLEKLLAKTESVCVKQVERQFIEMAAEHVPSLSNACQFLKEGCETDRLVDWRAGSVSASEYFDA